MNHEITIEERQVATATAYRGVCSCGTYRTQWYSTAGVAPYAFIEHLSTSPRSYDNAGVVVAVNNGYEVPQEGENVPQIIDWIETESFPQIAQWLREAGATVVLPLYDRGRGELQVGDADDTYTDVPLLGVVYDNAKVTREERAVDPTWDAEAAMRTELGEYNKWAEGDVWGYVIERQIPACTHCGCSQRWDVEDSVWGHIGYEYARVTAREALRSATES